MVSEKARESMKKSAEARRCPGCDRSNSLRMDITLRRHCRYCEYREQVTRTVGEISDSWNSAVKK